MPGHKDRQLLITFVPTSCVDGPDESWGTVSMDLDVAGFWSLGRTHEVPVMETNSLSVFEPAQVTDVPQTPLAAACALLGR